MSDYKIYEIENAIKLMNRMKIIRKVEHLAEIIEEPYPDEKIRQNRAEMKAMDLTIDVLEDALNKRKQKFRIRRVTI